MNKRRIVLGLTLTLVVLVQLACENATVTPFPVDSGASNSAQATLQDGPRQAMELSYQGTALSLSMNQAANAAAQTTLDYNRRQMMELSIQGTQVSQNMAWAAATQQFSSAQTQIALSAASTAQSQATQTAQAYATQTAYPLTATPWAAIQADILRTQQQNAQRAWWEEFVVFPLKATLLILVVLLLIVGGVMAYRRLMPVLELRLRTISRDPSSPLGLEEGMIVDADPDHSRQANSVLRQPTLSQIPGDETTQVEIVEPTDPSVAQWISEVEWKLRSEGRMGS
jgi:hypothetical protein